MFDHKHHQLIHLILNSLDSKIFRESGAYFGGGTLVSLLNGEFRWSKDIDFICPVGPGYKKLRSLIFQSAHNPSVFFNSTDGLDFPRDLVANQYGIRFLVMAGGTPIKFEIVAEGRITLNDPEYYNWPGLPCLCFEDQCTEKLLANSDRWLDSSIGSRDLIDLAILRLRRKFAAAAIQRAEEVQPVVDPLCRAIKKFIEKEQYREKCFRLLEIQNAQRVMEGMNLLAGDFK
ncbi:MAG: nucleotidyl transferase AbiEii/AbiGii toxin family protein [Pseudomonadota bacterium]|nr:nucleotidyl transferase AbiEii/AbiGii toxin family protein [Pseudomonadota bacterium]